MKERQGEEDRVGQGRGKGLENKRIGGGVGGRKGIDRGAVAKKWGRSEGKREEGGKGVWSVVEGKEKLEEGDGGRQAGAGGGECPT